MCVRVNKKLDPMCPVDAVFTLFRSALVKVALVAIYIYVHLYSTHKVTYPVQFSFQHLILFTVCDKSC